MYKRISQKIKMQDTLINELSENNCISNEFEPVEKKEKKNKKSSQPIKKKEPIDKKAINYKNYIDNSITLTSYKLPELKNAAKNIRLPVSGKKELLIARLEVFFNNTKNTIIIQKLFRGWIVRFAFKLSGPALLKRKLCLNDTDFVTMEPLVEIKRECFYSYTDKKDFTYGFNVVSLMQVIKAKGKIENPYNREKFDGQIVESVKTLFNLSCLIYPEFREENESLITQTPTNRRNVRTPTVFGNDIIGRLSNQQVTSNQVLDRLNTIRAKPINDRINELFMEIDSLGNYTQSSWMSTLDVRQYIRLYRSLYEIWNYRSNLSRDVKLRICPHISPFDGIFPRIIYHNDLTFNQIQNACVTVFENMVYQGVDEDHRKIGTFHALSGLTMVSDTARQAMPWLYESVAY